MAKTLKIYFAGSIAGGRAYQQTYQQMVQEIKRLGHQVLTEHVAQTNIFANEQKFTPAQIYDRDIAWLTESDALIAEVSSPSLGVGYEIRYAIELDRPILAVYKKEIRLSSLISGNPYKKMVLRPYQDTEEMFGFIRDFLAEI